MFFSAAVFYSLPKIIMYFVTLRGERSTLYDRLKKYFRTRIACLVLLFVILFIVNIFVLIWAEELSQPEAYDVSRHWIRFMGLMITLIWVGTDLYWSIKIRTYKDLKKGKKGEDAAKQISSILNTNDNIMSNVKEYRYKAMVDA